MAKTQATTAINPDKFILSAAILADAVGVLPILQLINWASGKRSECHVSMSVGPDGWDDWSGGNSLAVPCAQHTIDGTARQIYQWELWIDVEEAASAILEVGTECHCAVANAVTCVYTATGSSGSDTGTTVNDDTDNDAEVADSTGIRLKTVTTGGEWITVSVTAQRTSGASANNELRTVRAEVLDVTSSLPIPANN